MLSSQCFVSPSATASSLELKYRKKVARPTSAVSAICSTVVRASPSDATSAAAVVAIRSLVALRLRTLSESPETTFETTSILILCLIVAANDNLRAPKTVEAWAFVQQMLADITRIVNEDAENERELIEGLRVVARVTALCSELSVESDPDLPWFFAMCSPTRLIGGPNPDGAYLLAMIRGDRAYRVTGTRGTTAYLGIQVWPVPV